MTDAPTAFVNTAVVPMDAERLLEDHVVVIQDGRIAAVGAADQTRVPADAEVIDAKGGFLMPGLADMHVHLDMRDTDPAHLVLYLAEGTTTVRCMAGTPEIGRWRGQVEQGKLIGPTILSADRTLMGAVDPELLEMLPFAAPFFTPETVADAVDEVQRQAAGWADLVKVYDGLTEEQYLAAIAAAKDAGAYVAGHALDEASLETIMTSGIDEIAHLDELNFYHWIGSPGETSFSLDYGAIPRTAALMKENDVAIVSNLVADETMIDLIFDTEGTLSRPDYDTVRPGLVETWRTKGRQLGRFAEQGPYRRDLEMPFFKALVRALHEAGVTVTLGTDTSPLEGSLATQIHRDLELLVESGISAYEALAAGTKNAATIVERMGRDGGFGTVTPGRRADLVLLSSNPLEDVSHTKDRVGVMARGVWYSQVELDRMVADFVATY